MKWTMMMMMVQTSNFSCFFDNWCFDTVNSRHHFGAHCAWHLVRPFSISRNRHQMPIVYIARWAFFFPNIFYGSVYFIGSFFSLSRDCAFETHSIINSCSWANISLSTVCEFECVCVLVACLQLWIRLQADHRIIKFNDSYHCSLCCVLFNGRSFSTASRLLYPYIYFIWVSTR